MSDAIRAYAVGDRVISTRPLHAPPVEAWDVGVEIPAASTGEVVDVREYKYLYPYVVRFETGDLEISCAEDDITAVAVTVPADLDAVPQVKPARRPFLPTQNRPHVDCYGRHVLIESVYLGGFIALAWYEMAMAIGLFAMLVGLALLARFSTGTWGHLGKTDISPHVVVNPVWAKRAARSDKLHAIVAAAVVLSYIGQHAMGTPEAATFGLLVLGVGTWLTKELAHNRASKGVVTYDD